MSTGSEITEILRKEIENYTAEYKDANYGTVVQVGDNIAHIYGLSDVRAGELLRFENGEYGIIFNLEEYTIGCVILGDDTEIKEGQRVDRTGRIVEVPVGDALLGRVVNPLGQPIDGKGPIETDKFRPIERSAATVIERQPVDTPLSTGIKAIDALTPIGRGQREMIIGDRQTGKTAIAIDAILNQTPGDVYCIYVAIGQKASTVSSVVNILEKYDRLKNTIIIAATANYPASMLYIAPYAGCAMAEEFMFTGRDALIIYDDLSKHANAYRELSLLLRRPPGREAFPGDVFYLHSRLLERSAKLSKDLGGGSSTALPIIETQMGDVSAYIPTNVISITDGQIYLDKDLFHQGIRPAVDVGISISRVGGAAQISAMKKVAGTLRLDLSQFRELEAFLKFSSDEMDKGCNDQIIRGQRIVEALKQEQFSPVSTPYQVALLYALSQPQFDVVPTERILDVEKPFYNYLKTRYPDYENEILTTGKFTDRAKEILDKAIVEFIQNYVEKGLQDVERSGDTLSFGQTLMKRVMEGREQLDQLEESMEANLSKAKDGAASANE